MNRLLPAVALVVASSHAFAQTPPAAAEPTTDAAPADADPAAKAEAKRRFEHAIKLYEDGDYAVALAEFERVYQLVPDYRVLYNIGQVSIQLGHYARALLTLREYVQRGGAQLPSDRARAVQADLDLLAGRTASITLQAEPDGAEVTIDGRAVGRVPLAAPIVVDVGERRLELKRTGFVTQAQTLSLAGGDRKVAELKLVPEPAAPAKPTPTPNVVAPPPLTTTPAPAAPKRSWAWAGYSSASVLAAGALVSGVMGASATNQLKDLREAPGTSRPALEQAQSRAKTRLLIADVLGGAALATAAVTLYFQLSSSSGDERSRATNDVWLGVAPDRVTLGLALP